MYGTIIPGLALEGSSILCSYTRVYHCKKMIKKIITACNDQSVLQIFSACSENDGMEYFPCNVIRSLFWGKIVHFTCITKDWYVFCPCWCAVVFSAQLLVFCDSFLMKLGLGVAVPSISFIFLWHCVLAWIQILKSWGSSAEALTDIGFHPPEEKLFLLLWSCISPVT